MDDHSLANRGLAVWFTGLSASGKTTLCRALEPELRALGYEVQVLDADDLRQGLCRDLGFTKADRDENVARIGSIANALVQQNCIVLVAAISPYQDARAEVRARIGSFLEVHVDAPLALCICRDPKGLYARALRAELPNFTGIDDPYEPPVAPDVHCETGREALNESKAKVLAAIEEALHRQLLAATPA